MVFCQHTHCFPNVIKLVIGFCKFIRLVFLSVYRQARLSTVPKKRRKKMNEGWQWGKFTLRVMVRFSSNSSCRSGSWAAPTLWRVPCDLPSTGEDGSQRTPPLSRPPPWGKRSRWSLGWGVTSNPS
jgi:hypothetical protein